jgi:hypothetical protein
MKNLNNVASYWPTPAATRRGTYVWHLARRQTFAGQVIVRVITRLDASELVKALRREDYMITTVNAEGAMGR